MKKLILIATMILLSSCAGLTQKYGNQEVFNDSKISKLEKGETTKNEIVSMFGKPSNTYFTANNWNTKEEVSMTYTGSYSKTTSLILIPIIGEIIMIGKANGGTYTKSGTLNLALDKHNVLKDYDYQFEDNN